MQNTNIQKIIAIALASLSGLLIAGALMNILEGKSEHKLVTDLVMLMILGILPFSMSVYWYRNLHNKAKRRKFEDTEKMILRLAAQVGGKMTATELALKTSISTEEAKKHLDKLHEKGLTTLLITQEGEILYEFKGLSSSAIDTDNSERL